MTTPDQEYDLDRFVEAQAGVFDDALAELAAGRKASHWMWFVFPQLRGLGQSVTAQRYGLTSLAEARAYRRHPLLGERLRRSCEQLLAQRGKTAFQILGSPDDRKLCSCLTLFELADPAEPLFGQLLAQYFGGRRDGRTLALIAAGG